MTRRMSRAQKLWMAERAIVLQVLRDDHAELWTLEELEREIEDLPAEIVRGAVRRLGGRGRGGAQRGGVQGVAGCAPPTMISPTTLGGPKTPIPRMRRGRGPRRTRRCWRS
jgi:hypothetical protein